MRARDFISEARTGYDKHGRLVTTNGPLKIIKNPSGDTTWWIDKEPVGFFEFSSKGPGRYMWYSMPDDALGSDERELIKKMPDMIARQPTVVSKEVFDQLLQAELVDRT
jgi:hypothetical protein